MFAIGHRGAAGHAPENTLKAIRKALELGVTWVELDVYAVRDGDCKRLVVFHDDTLERTTNGNGYILEKEFSYLQSLDAGEGEKIPTLEEVFDLVNKKISINIELKGPDTAQMMVKFLKDQVSAGWRWEQFLVSSFNHPQIAQVKSLEKKIETGALIYGLPLHYAAFAQELGVSNVNPSIDFINEPFVADAHKRGLKVWAYTANRHEDISRKKDLGVDAVFSDFPERVL